MKPKEDNLEKNVSRLVKLAADSDKPSSTFVDSVMENALDELKAPEAERTRGGMGKSTRVKWLKKFAYAAAIFIACGFLLSAILMPALAPVRELAMRSAFKQAVLYCDSAYPIHAPMAHGGTTPPNGEDVDGMFFKNYGVNPFVDTEDDHLSTFATDVDTGSYTIVRRYLHDGHLPPEKAVRVEEFVNYFNYGYAAPQEETFAVYAEAAPWKFGTGRKNSYLLRLGLKGKQVSEENRKPAILTFVIDVSGSMNRENRLGLVKRSLRILVERLREEDQMGLLYTAAEAGK